MKLKITKLQQIQLVILAGSHFVVDLFAGLLPAIIPVLMSVFSISLSRAVAVLTVLNVAANFVQLITGHLREDKKKPFFLYLGLICSPAICLIALLPTGPGSYPAMLLLAFISGCGVAVTHPEGLKAVHALKRISSAMSSSVYLSCGFFGYSVAGFISAALVAAFGLKSLCWLLVCPAACLFGLWYFRIRVAVERNPFVSPAYDSKNQTVSFWLIYVMAVAATTTTTIIIGLIPTRLNELGFGLAFGGFSTMILGIACAFGAFFWAAVAKRCSELTSTAIALTVGVPLLIIYFFMIDSRTAVLVLAATGFSSAAAYPVMVSMARNAGGLKLGRRMAFIVGGAWGPASLLLMVAGYAAEHFGLQKVLNLTPIGYAVAAAMAIVVLIQKKRRTIS